MERGIPLREFVGGRTDAAPVTYQRVGANAPNLEVNPPEFGLSSREHGREPTVLTESTWRSAITAAVVFALLFVAAAVVFSLLGWLNTRAVLRDANGGATKCSSSGLFSAVFDSCRVVRRLPLVVTENGACYRFATDLVWAGGAEDGPAIDWWGNRGELHACGHNLTLTNQTGQGVLVHGSLFEDVENPVAGELTAYDLFVTAPTQQYNELAYAVRVQNGATLWLQDAVFQNTYTAVMARNAKLIASGVNVTVSLSLDDENRALAWDSDLWAFDAFGVNCMGSVDCSVEDYSFAAANDDASGDYRAVPMGLASIGYQCNYSPFDTSTASGAGFCRLERAQITASQPLRALNAHSMILRDVQLALLGGAENLFDTTFWGNVTEFPLNAPMGWNIGAVLQVENGSSAIVERLSVDATALTPHSMVNSAMQISSTNGLVFKDSNVFGRAPLAEWAIETYFAPGWAYLQLGLVAIDSVVFVDEPVSPITVSDVNVKVVDTTSYALSVGTARAEFGEFLVCETSNITASFDRCSFIGGAAGVLVGSGAVDQLAFKDCRFHGSYYGLFFSNESRNTLFEAGYFTRHCEAIHIEPEATNVIVDRGHFSNNNFNVVDLNGDPNAILLDIVPLPDSNVTCPDAAPYLFNVNITDCVAASAEVEAHARSARLAGIRAKFGA
jgi:hypothetical protein